MMEWASLVSKHAWARPVDLREKVPEVEDDMDEVDCWGKSTTSKCRRYFKLKPC